MSIALPNQLLSLPSVAGGGLTPGFPSSPANPAAWDHSQPPTPSVFLAASAPGPGLQPTAKEFVPGAALKVTADEFRPSWAAQQPGSPVKGPHRLDLSPKLPGVGEEEEEDQETTNVDAADGAAEVDVVTDSDVERPNAVEEVTEVVTNSEDEGVDDGPTTAVDEGASGGTVTDSESGSQANQSDTAADDDAEEDDVPLAELSRRAFNRHRPSVTAFSGYEGGDDDAGEESDGTTEYSNPSDEERARERRTARQGRRFASDDRAPAGDWVDEDSGGKRVKKGTHASELKRASSSAFRFRPLPEIPGHGRPPSLISPTSLGVPGLPPLRPSSPLRSNMFAEDRSGGGSGLSVFASEFQPAFTFSSPGPKMPDPSLMGMVSPKQHKMEPSLATISSGSKRQKLETGESISSSDGQVLVGPQRPTTPVERPGKDRMKTFKFPNTSPSPVTPTTGASSLNLTPVHTPSQASITTLPQSATRVEAGVPAGAQFGTLARSAAAPKPPSFEVVAADPPKARLADLFERSPEKKRPAIPNSSIQPPPAPRSGSVTPLAQHTSAAEIKGSGGRTPLLGHTPYGSSNRSLEEFDDEKVLSIARSRAGAAIPIAHEDGPSAEASQSFPRSPQEGMFPGDYSDRRSHPSITDAGSSLMGSDARDLALAGILERQFADLKADMKASHSLRMDWDSITRDALLDSLTARLDEMLASWSKTLGVREPDAAGETDFEAIRELIADGQRRLHVAVSDAVRQSTSHFPTQILAETTRAHRQGSTINEDQQRELISCLLSEFRLQFATIRSQEEANSQHRVVEFADAIVARVTPDLIQTLETTRAPQDDDALASNIVESLLPHLGPNQTPTLDVDAVAAGMTQAVKPHISALIELVSDKKETAGSIVEAIRPDLDKWQSAVAKSLDADALSKGLVEGLDGPFKSQLDLLASRFEDAVGGEFRKSLALHAAQMGKKLELASKAASRNDLEASISDLSTKLNSDLQLQLGAISESLVGAFKEHTNLKSTEADAQRIHDLEAELVKLRASLETSRTDAQLADNARTLREERAIEAYASGKDKMEAELANVRKQLEARQTAATEAQTSATVMVSELKEALAKERDTVVALNQKLATFEDQRQCAGFVARVRLPTEADLARRCTLHMALRTAETALATTHRQLHHTMGQLESLQEAAESHKERGAWNLACIDRMRADRADEVEEADRRAAELRLRAEAAEQGKRAVEEKLGAEVNEAWQAKARMEGTVAALEKRIQNQDEKLSNLHRSAAAKQQSHATATQRLAEVEKRAKADIEAGRTEASRVPGLESDLDAARARIQELEAQVEEYRIERDAVRLEVEKMHRTVSDELAQSATKVSTAERARSAAQHEVERLRTQAEALERELECERATNTDADRHVNTNGTTMEHGYPTPRQEPLPSASPSPLARDGRSAPAKKGSDHPREAGLVGSSTTIPVHKGHGHGRGHSDASSSRSSNGTVRSGHPYPLGVLQNRRPSPTPSKMSVATRATMDEHGWWS